MLAADHLTHVPGVWDPASAALAVRAGHRAVHLSGAAIAATMLGRPDLDRTPATQLADRAATLVPGRAARRTSGGEPIGDRLTDRPATTTASRIAKIET